MDKVLSARVDQAVIQRIGMLASRLGTSKKAVIERAILDLAKKVEASQDLDLLGQTFGAWDREEAPAESAAEAREVFRKSMERHHR